MQSPIQNCPLSCTQLYEQAILQALYYVNTTMNKGMIHANIYRHLHIGELVMVEQGSVVWGILVTPNFIKDWTMCPFM